MIRIAALNEEKEEESDSEIEVTKEALEQIALQQYAKALDLHRKGNSADATQLLKDLLDTELLYDVRKPGQGEKASSPLLNLKYLCYKNLARMLVEDGEVEAAIESYLSASELDDTDVTLWHRLGLLCLQDKQYEMALYAFQRGGECNPRHWPCLDNIVTLQLALGYKEECITTIHDTLQLDPDYLRGLVYRKHIYTDYPYIRRYMERLNPMYKWSECDDDFDEGMSEKLIKEAQDIKEIFVEQRRAEQTKYVVPELKLIKPITHLTWESVGDSLVHMHHYITENCYSHASRLEIVFEKEQDERKEENLMEVCEEPHEQEKEDSKPKEILEPEKITDNGSENDNNELSDKDKAATDTEKVESDIEIVPAESAEKIATENTQEPKKKTGVRRRGSDLNNLRQWGWYYTRRSGRKKENNSKKNKQDCSDENIYDILRKMVPVHLSPEMIQKKEFQARETSPDTRDLGILFDEKEIEKKDDKKIDDKYFGTENEQKDVKTFINKYTETKSDIIDILKDFLIILAAKWREKWSEKLPKIFVEANQCFNNHIDVPAPTVVNQEELLHYTAVNILVEEFIVNQKLKSTEEDKQSHELNVIESIAVTLSLTPQIFSGTDCMELTIRHLWVKLHIHLLNKCEEFALDCLYRLTYEFEAMGEYHDGYSLNIINFNFKPTINEQELTAYIKFLQRNKRLSTVMTLYDEGDYEKVLSIILDSFEYSKSMSGKEEEESSLDFAAQLALILDSYWGLEKPNDCLKWAFISLHEALKHFFRHTSGTSDHKKWSQAIIKILCCIEHILTTQGLFCLNSISAKELSQGLEDLIRVIGHQVETFSGMSNSDMPLNTVVPWIILHFIFQREEDHSTGRMPHDKEMLCDEIPNSLMVLFIAHEFLGSKGWCCISDGKLLYFILDKVVPLLRLPALAKSLEQICQYMEQCVFCLFGHPSKKNNKIRYLDDHKVTPKTLDWSSAQQVYEIFRPPILPPFEGKLSGINGETDQLFRSILKLLPAENDPQKYLPEIEKYITGTENKLPKIPQMMPFKMRDIYFLLGDYYFKKDERKLAVKYNTLDVLINSNRVASWAELALTKAANLGIRLNSCKNLHNESEYLKSAKSTIKCFKRALDLDPTHCNLWIEYGNFVYSVHSFCSRLLKQASESLSMDDFESLEKQKEDMLDITQKCFTMVHADLHVSDDSEKPNEDSWLLFYMLGKVAEKRNKPPSSYLKYYMQAVKSLADGDATYPLKINCSASVNLCIEVLELHYRIHASILKYIEQHENKPIPGSVGTVFMKCIDEWKNGPFSKKPKKDGVNTNENEAKPSNESTTAANIYKRSVSDVGEDETHEMKKLKLESAAAKVRRSASYDTEIVSKDTTSMVQLNDTTKTIEDTAELKLESEVMDVEITSAVIDVSETQTSIVQENPKSLPVTDAKENITENLQTQTTSTKDGAVPKKVESSSSTSSSSSSDSSSSDSTSDSNSDSARESDTSSKSTLDKPLTEAETMNIVSSCLEALEDCASRFPPHYKAIYRLAHYHFYYKKGKDIERCRDLMLLTCTSKSGQKLNGLFSEKKPSNFFNNIWKIPIDEVDRPGSFSFHMNRCVLLTMEILKQIDDHKTLLELSIHLQRIPEPDKTYLRNPDREDLAQQAFSLCVQSLKGQLLKFSQQSDLKSNEVEQQAFKCLMLDIYKAYQKVQKYPTSKQFSNLLVDAYKLITTNTITENMNLVDLSMKYCQSILAALRQQMTQASIEKSQNAQKKQAAKAAESLKATSTVASQPKQDTKANTDRVPAIPTPTASTTALPRMSQNDMSAAFQSYLPMLNDSMLNQQTQAALSYLTTLTQYPAYQNSLQASLQSSLQNSFQAEFYRQFLGQTLSSYLPPPKKKRGPKSGSTRAPSSQIRPSKTFTATPVLSSKPSTSVSSLQKSTSLPLTPSMGTVLSTLPPSMSANLSSFGASNSSAQSTPAQAHMSKSSTSVNTGVHSKPPLPHQQTSPGKTLQEKLAERQKNMPTSKSSGDINTSLGKLPSSLSITKTSANKHAMVQGKKPDAKKIQKPITSDEIIILDDD